LTIRELRTLAATTVEHFALQGLAAAGTAGVSGVAAFLVGLIAVAAAMVAATAIFGPLPLPPELWLLSWLEWSSAANSGPLTPLSARAMIAASAAAL